jgi:hypothetical protein
MGGGIRASICGAMGAYMYAYNASNTTHVDGNDNEGNVGTPKDETNGTNAGNEDTVVIEP